MFPRRLIGGLAVALLLAAAWQLGERRGFERGTSRADALAAREAERRLAAAGAADAATIAALRGEREMLSESVRGLRDALDRAGRLAAEERSELELYRRIGAAGGAAGLAIDTLERRPADPASGAPATLRLTLVQVRGRDRVSGRVDVVALEEDAPPLAPETAGDVRAAIARDGRAIWTAPFDLRFFETLDVPLGDAFPARFEVRVVPSTWRHEPFRRRYDRDDAALVD